MKNIAFGVFGFLVVLLAVTTVTASDTSEKSSEEGNILPGWYMNMEFWAVYNPWAVVLTSELTYQIPLKYKDGMVWSHAELGYHASATVVDSTYGAHIEWMPAAFIRLRANYDIRVFHGVMGSLLEFESKDSPHNIPDLYDYKGVRGGMGHRLWFSPILQLYYEGLLFFNITELKWFLIDSDAPYFYNWEYSTISQTTDVVFSNNASLMYNLFKRHTLRTLFVGAAYDFVFQPSTSFRRQIVGIAMFTEPFKKVYRVGKIHFQGFAGLYVEETYHSMEPYVLINVGTNLDFRKNGLNE